MLKFNPNTKLILSDVDETIADVYTDATPEVIASLNRILTDNIVLFLVSGGGLQSIRERITNKLDPSLRHKVLVSHCSGAEVWGFQANGEINNEPYYGVYDQKMTDVQKKRWREIINDMINKYNLKVYPTMAASKFLEVTNGDSQSVMLADRGPQITLEFPNDESLRHGIMSELDEIYKAENFPAHTKLGGAFALDNILEGVNKTFAIDTILKTKYLLESLNLPLNILEDAGLIEIWGDKFESDGPDFMMCKAVLPEVRSIDFRNEDPQKLPTGYNIVMWNGNKRLHEGLLEYLTQQ